MVNRMLVVVDEDMVIVVEDKERRGKCGGDGEQLLCRWKDGCTTMRDSGVKNK